MPRTKIINYCTPVVRKSFSFSLWRLVVVVSERLGLGEGFSVVRLMVAVGINEYCPSLFSDFFSFSLSLTVSENVRWCFLFSFPPFPTFPSPSVYVILPGRPSVFLIVSFNYFHRCFAPPPHNLTVLHCTENSPSPSFKPLLLFLSQDPLFVFTLV